MKKIFYSLISGLAFALLLSACTDFNDQFEGIDTVAKPTNLAAYTYTLLDADYSAISKSALAVATTSTETTYANSIASNKYFTNAVSSAIYVPYLLKTKYPYADLGSTANITFSFGDDRPTFLSDLTTVNILVDADYKSAWGAGPFVSAFTPAVSPSAKLPAILAAKFPTATSGQYKFVEYNNSSIEATTQSTEITYFAEDWTSHTYLPSPYAVIADNGWMSKDVLGTKNWLDRTFSSNYYAQVTSNASNQKNEIWMISKEIDLQAAIAPKFTFDITVGYWNANCLSVLVSENFNGTEAGITTATWTNISSSFTFPETPTNAYGVLANAGIADLTAYKGKKVRVAFKYSGDGRSATDRGTDPLKTTTYQLDNIKVSETKVALSVASSEKQYAIYTFNGSSWTAAATSSFVSLQLADYTALGLPYISSANAPLYIPQLLSLKYPFAQEGNVKTAVYKSGSNVTYAGATQYTFTKGVWVPNSFKTTKTEQYIFSNSGWVFDPTIKLALVRVTGDNPYIMKFIDYIRTKTAEKFYQKGTYVNEEHYYGFSAYYAQIICSADRTTYGDPAIKALTTDAAKYVLFLDRVKEAMPLFTQLNYPDLKTDVSGIQQYVIFTIASYYSSSKAGTLTIKMKCTKAGTGTTPAEYTVESLVETF
jgi:hypothetical protein